MDLEDACAPSVKEAARQNVITMLNDNDWGRTKRAVRVNGLDTVWCHDDVVEVVTAAGANLDVINHRGGPRGRHRSHRLPVSRFPRSRRIPGRLRNGRRSGFRR
jgi:hypothetical protein